MYQNIIKKYINQNYGEKEILNYLNLLNSKKIKPDKHIFILYDKNGYDIYLLEEYSNRILKKYNKKNNLFEIDNDDKKAEFLTVKKTVIFDSTDANRAIGRGNGKKDDMAIYSLAEASFNFKSFLEFNKDSLNMYLNNKQKRVSFDNIKEKIKKGSLKINGNENQYLIIMQNRFNYLNQISRFDLFKNTLADIVKNEYIQKIQELDQINPDKISIRITVADKNIANNINIDLFNKFYSFSVKELKIENDKIYYPLNFNDTLKEKPLISKVNPVYNKEDDIFKIFFFMKYITKTLKNGIEKGTEEHFKKNIAEPFYYFENIDSAVSFFDVITTSVKTIKPPFKLINFYDYMTDKKFNSLENDSKYVKNIDNYYKLLDEINFIILNVVLKSNNKNRKGDSNNELKMFGTDIKRMKLQSFSSEEELNMSVKQLFKNIYNYKDFFIEKVLKNNAEKPLNNNKGLINIFKTAGFILSVQNYISNKGENMNVINRLNQIDEQFKELVLKLKKGDKNVDELLNPEFLSYVGGNVIKYFINKKKGDKKNVNVGLLIPIYENIRTMKDLKEEVNKALTAYGYEESLGNSVNKVVALLNGIDNDVKIDKNMLIAGMLDGNNPAFYVKAEENQINEKGDNNE